MPAYESKGLRLPANSRISSDSSIHSKSNYMEIFSMHMLSLNKYCSTDSVCIKGANLGQFFYTDYYFDSPPPKDSDKLWSFKKTIMHLTRPIRSLDKI